MAERVALITGGARGIGRAVSIELAARGWSVAVGYRTSEKAAAETLDAVRLLGRAASAHRADLCDPQEAGALVGTVTEQHGRIDALVHCAGPYHRVDLMKETVEGWRSMFDGNLHSLFYCARAVAPRMIERRWGRIVAFSLVNADRLVAQPQLTAHYIAKVGVLALVRSLAKALAPHGITANCISPGFVDSGSVDADEVRRILPTIPAGRTGTVKEAAATVAFLLGEDAAYINGGNIPLSGGWGI